MKGSPTSTTGGRLSQASDGRESGGGRDANARRSADGSGAKTARQKRESELRLELWIREPIPHGTHGAVERIRERAVALADAESESGVGDVELHAWGKHVAAEDDTDVAARARERWSAFRAWAERNDVDLGSAFRRRAVRSAVLGETREVIALPTVCLAIHGDDLLAVYPCDDGDGVRTVPDALEELERGDWTAMADGSAIDRAPDR